ncbi:spore coat protein [Paenibacillus sp. P25]|nr:spore coat protein [Paenibacillus sp. P25]
MYQQQINPQMALFQHTHLQEQDWGNLVLSELKRTAREYATASLEATHPAIRQSFVTLCQKTLNDQWELYNVLSQQNGYGQVHMATQQEVQQELQRHFQKAEQLHSFVQQAIQSSYASAGAYQQAAYPQQRPAFQRPSAYMHQSAHAGAQAGLTGGYTAHGQGASSTSSGFQSAYGNQSFSPGSAGSSSFGYGTGSTYSQTQGTSAQDGSEVQDYFSAKSAQDYTSNKYTSGTQETFSARSGQDQSYASTGSAAGRPSGSHAYGGGTAETSGDAAVSSSGTGSRAQQQGGTTHGSKYMM